MANTFTFANQTLTDADIYGGISYMCDLNTGDEFSIGNTASACVKFVTDKQVPIYTKDSTNGYFEWVQDLVSRGTYYVTEVTKINGSWYSVTAYDAMILLDTSISALSLSFPLTVSAAASAIATYLGCTTSGTIYNGTMACDALDDTTTIRELLGWVAEASGASVKIDAADHIVFLYYAASGITVTASDYKEDGLDVADYTCAAIDNVTILDMAGMPHATAGAGTNSLFIQGNPFMYEATNTEAAVILGLVDSFVYAPFTCEMFDENGLDVGMTATFGTVTSLVMHIESSEDGATASAVGSDSRAELNKDLDVMVNEALSTATALSQHFWYTASGAEAGAHIAEVDKATFEANPAGGNLLSSSNGIAVRDGLTELAAFGASGAVIGEVVNNKRHIEIDTDGLRLVNGTSQELAHLGYGQVYDENGSLTTERYFTLGERDPGNVGENSFLVGLDSLASGYCSVSEGRENKAIGNQSHVGGMHCQAKKANSFAFGDGCVANGENQFVVGKKNVQDTTSLFIVGASDIDADASNAFKVKSDGIYVGDHTSPIGTVLTGTRTASAGAVSTSYSTVASVLLTAGTWVITAFNSFNGSYNGNNAAAGTRRVLITSSSSGATDAGEGSACGYAPSGTQVTIRSMLIASISANTTFYLRCKSAAQVDSPYGNLKAVRIA